MRLSFYLVCNLLIQTSALGKLWEALIYTLRSTQSNKTKFIHIFNSDSVADFLISKPGFSATVEFFDRRQIVYIKAEIITLKYKIYGQLDGLDLVIIETFFFKLSH